MRHKINSVTDFPKEGKYILIIFSTTSVTTPADERSRTNPGHGFSETTEQISTSEIYSFDTLASLQAELTRLYERDRTRQDILVLEINRMIPVKASISIQL